MITEVITFATTDEITLTENGDAKRGENGMFNEENSGRLILSNEANEKLFRINGASCALKLLTKMIAHGPRQYSFHLDELTDVLKKGTEVFLHEPSLLEVPVPCVVYGDIHGQYSDLHRWFNLNGWPWKVRSVFLGDFVDRGTHGIEVIALLTALKVAFPDRLFICRGNHEEESLNRAYSFLDEILIRFPNTADNEKGQALYRYFKEMFNAMPLAALIGGRILGMHGGISPKLTSLQAIRDIQRPLEDFEVGSLACDLVWSDPDTNPERSGFRPNLEREPNKGIGQLFGSDTVQKLCEKLNIELIIRGHQAPLQGYAIFADGCLMTLFSAPGYKGSTKSDINMGASLQISANMNITIKRIEVTEKFRQNRVQDGENMRTLSKGIRRCRS
uniref:protein-serine/threonine phosphatase n=1 Tax=Ascaris suum TaxID=6253 RepID=F1KYL0_ASCSU